MLKQTNINIMHSGIVNKIRYDDLGKPIKQISFTVENLRGNLLEKQFTIVKRSFRYNTKSLSLDSTIPVDEFTVETFYHFRTSELSSIWTPLMMHESSTWLTLLNEFQYVTNSSNLKKMFLAATFFTSSTIKIKNYLVTKP